MQNPEPMELETTPPLPRRPMFCSIVPEREYKPCRTKLEAEARLLDCQAYALQFGKHMNQSQAQWMLLEILDAKDELSLFASSCEDAKREKK